ncbi:JmjC domain-containing protein [Kitasatospora kazusensis]
MRTSTGLEPSAARQDFTALGSLVGDVPGFLATAWRREARVLRPDRPPLDAVTLTDLDRVLLGSRLRLPYLEMLKAGRHQPPDRFTGNRLVGGVSYHGWADRAGVLRELADGATLLLRNVEHWHEPVAALTRCLAGELGRRVEAFVFVTPPGAQGLRTHRDDADVFVVQLNGRKRWNVHRPPQDGDWAAAPEPNPGPPILEAAVETGEVLYIPRGAPHSAVGDQEGLSVHLSLTVRQAGTDDLQAALRERLESGPRVAPLPVDEAGMLAAAAELLARYRRCLDSLTPAQLVDAADTAVRTALQGTGQADAGPLPSVLDFARSLVGPAADAPA